MQNPPWIDFETQASSAPAVVGTPPASDSKTPDETLGAIMLIIPVITTLLIWFWVGEMNLLQNPRSSLNMLIVLTVVSTGILAYIEAEKLGIGSETDLDEKGKRR